jgi:maltooligosyltrehalose trehalohydrolase
MDTMKIERRLPIGAEVQPGGGTHFRVWAPRRRRVAVALEGAAGQAAGRERILFKLTPEPGGYFSGLVPEARADTLYRYQLDDDSNRYPDPASRFQPQGPHGPSQVVDSTRFSWTDTAWGGVAAVGQVIYEMHIGTFTRAGTWEAAIHELPELAAAGITVLEVMPVGDFPGNFGWGYDGVNLFAPTRLYGMPDDFRRFIDRAHACGLGVILDVVYNHLGPDGNYLAQFAQHYFTDRYKNEWGEAVNFDDAHTGPVREFFIANAGYWIDEFHLDGLRLDATQQIFDASPDHILAAVNRRVREAGGKRATYVVAENEKQQARVVRPVADGGYGLDAQWNDDFHHCALVAITGHNEGYYTDYLGQPQELLSALKWGFLYQGQWYRWQRKGRGTPALDLKPTQFVTFLENHDQVANSARGQRLHQRTSPSRYRALTAVLLLGPQTPLLFQGQEFAASSPFLFFADHHKELGALVRKGRKEFMEQFPSLKRPDIQKCFADPGSPATFEMCKLDFSERKRHAWAYDLHRDLLRLRREDAVFRNPRPRGVDGMVLGPQAFLLRYFGAGGDDRLVLVSLGCDLHLDPAPEPLLAPPEDRTWHILWSSENPRYGGCDIAPVEAEGRWRIPGEATVVLGPVMVRETT